MPSNATSPVSPEALQLAGRITEQDRVKVEMAKLGLQKQAMAQDMLRLKVQQEEATERRRVVQEEGAKQRLSRSADFQRLNEFRAEEGRLSREHDMKAQEADRLANEEWAKRTERIETERQAINLEAATRRDLTALDLKKIEITTQKELTKRFADYTTAQVDLAETVDEADAIITSAVEGGLDQLADVSTLEEVMEPANERISSLETSSLWDSLVTQVDERTGFGNLDPRKGVGAGGMILSDYTHQYQMERTQLVDPKAAEKVQLLLADPNKTVKARDEFGGQIHMPQTSGRGTRTRTKPLEGKEAAANIVTAALVEHARLMEGGTDNESIEDLATALSMVVEKAAGGKVDEAQFKELMGKSGISATLIWMTDRMARSVGNRVNQPRTRKDKKRKGVEASVAGGEAAADRILSRLSHTAKTMAPIKSKEEIEDFTRDFTRQLRSARTVPALMKLRSKLQKEGKGRHIQILDEVLSEVIEQRQRVEDETDLVKGLMTGMRGAQDAGAEELIDAAILKTQEGGAQDVEALRGLIDVE